MRFKDKINYWFSRWNRFKTALDFGNEGAIVAVTDIDFEMAKKLSNQIISNGNLQNLSIRCNKFRTNKKYI